MNNKNRELKKAWKTQQKLSAKETFPLNDEFLASLFDFVESAIEGNGCDDTRRFTEQWLTEYQQPTDEVEIWLDNTGGFCDCEVVSNSLDFWEQNR